MALAATKTASAAARQTTQSTPRCKDESISDVIIQGISPDDRSLVDWDGAQDPSNPLNWSTPRKVLSVLSLCCLAFSTSFSSSLFAPAAIPLAAEFHVTDVVANLGVGLYVLGFAAGPLLWGPLSEAWGRQRPFFIALALFTTFQVPVAVARNIPTILVCRFICGAAGSASFAIPPAMAVDFLTPEQRRFCVNFYLTFTFVGPPTGPVAGAYLTVNHGWRWTAWVSLIIAAVSSTFAVLVIKESCGEILLQRKAAKLRKQTGNDHILSKWDQRPVTADVLMKRYLTKSISILANEPILLPMTIYSSLVFGVLYLLFFSLPYAFTHHRRWSVKASSLPFLSILVGNCLGCAIGAAIDATWWRKRCVARGRVLLPEDRLPQLMISVLVLPVGLLWFAWTSSSSIPWPAQVVSGVIIGAGIVLNLLSTTAYLIDVYLFNANSATAAYVCVRSATAFAFPLFAVQMFERLGVAWAASLLAGICVLLAPMPFLFWRYGKRVRGWSRYAFDL